MRDLSAIDGISATGGLYWAYFGANRRGVLLTASHTPDGTGFGVWIGAASAQADDVWLNADYHGFATGVLDTDRSEIRITAQLADLRSHVRIDRGTPLTGLQAISHQQAGEQGALGHGSAGGGPVADRSETRRAYAAGSPTCVAVGH